METTKNIIDYMIDQNISFEIVSKETGVPVKKFLTQGNEPLNATELCEVCTYLGIKPEQFYIKKVK